MCDVIILNSKLANKPKWCMKIDNKIFSEDLSSQRVKPQSSKNIEGNKHHNCTIRMSLKHLASALHSIRLYSGPLHGSSCDTSMFFLASSHIFQSYLHVFVHDQKKNAFEHLPSSATASSWLHLLLCRVRVCEFVTVRHTRTHIQFFSSQLNNTLRTFLANLFGFVPIALPSNNCCRHRCHRRCRRLHRFQTLLRAHSYTYYLCCFYARYAVNMLSLQFLIRFASLVKGSDLSFFFFTFFSRWLQMKHTFPANTTHSSSISIVCGVLGYLTFLFSPLFQVCPNI